MAKKIRLRRARPGDLGWMVHRHGLLDAREYGYDQRFEGVVAEVVAHFIRHFDPRRERCWIAQQGGRIVGSVMLVKRSARVAQLRLLLVEPEARGSGLGGRLVGVCVRFARRAGYRKIMLWTHQWLTGARKLYERAGFRRVSAKATRSFGLELVDEIWELKL